MKYNPALDGLRAVAITLVLLTHSFTHLFPGGWIGVDVFFVLSGYLITSILLKEIRETGGIAWGRFYWRRALRLTPALAFLAIFQFAHAAISPHNAVEISNATLVGIAYIENLNIVFGFAPSDVIGHTWSLATEEQFYLILPIALLALSRRHPARWIGLAIVAMLVWRLWIWRSGAALGHIQNGPDARPIGLLIGCLLALIPARRWPQLPSAAPFALLGLLGGICVACRLDMGWLMIFAPMIASVAATGLIMAAQQGTAGLAWAPAVYIGKISYGLYLYSAPICFLGATKGVNPLVLLAVSVAAAALSYEFVEKPVLRLRDWRAARLPAAVAAG